MDVDVLCLFGFLSFLCLWWYTILMKVWECITSVIRFLYQCDHSVSRERSRGWTKLRSINCIIMTKTVFESVTSRLPSVQVGIGYTVIFWLTITVLSANFNPMRLFSILSTIKILFKFDLLMSKQLIHKCIFSHNIYLFQNYNKNIAQK